MNIFVLDRKPNLAALYHNDRHCVKMVIEYAQILSTVLRLKRGKTAVFARDIKNTILPQEDHGKGYKKYKWGLHGETPTGPFIYLCSHINHPVVQWANTSLKNWLWLWELADYTAQEYTYRYGKLHAAHQVIKNCKKFQLDSLGNFKPLQVDEFISDKLTVPKLCMPDECKKFSDPVECYRLYYCVYKKDFNKWKNREEPEWVYKYTKLATLNKMI